MEGIIVGELNILNVVHRDIVNASLLSIEGYESYYVAQRSDRQFGESGNGFPGEVDGADAHNLMKNFVIFFRLVWTHDTNCQAKSELPYLKKRDFLWKGNEIMIQ